MDYKQLAQRQKEALVKYFKKNWLKILIFTLTVTFVITYFTVFYRRVPRALAKLDPYIRELDLHPVSACPKLIKNGYLLCDFYIASSFRSFLPCNQYYDYSSLEMITKAMVCGARYIELDIFNKDFCQETTPVVCVGQEVGNWHHSTKLTVDECFATISQNAFTGTLRNYSDPFFLCLNLYVDDNLRTMDKIADSLITYLKNWLLDSSYSYQNTNIAQVPLKNLLSKLVILCNQRCQESKLAEYINYTWDQPFMRNYSSVEIEDLHEPTEVTDYNRKNLTRVYPSFTDRVTKNYNPRPSWMYGCQFVTMNYQKMDDNMVIYLKKFKKCSFVLKPYKLRFHPNTYKDPKPQTKKVSFAPEQITTPYYSITY